MSNPDLYALLGADKSASDSELKQKYRKLAMQYHPDRNPGDKEAEKKFKEISHAYDILKDPEKRAAYDRYGEAAFNGGMGGGPGGFGGGAGGFEFSGNFSDIFDHFFSDFMGGSGPGGRENAAAGNDMRYNLEVSLEEAFTGKQVTLRIPSKAQCDACDGTGAEKGTKPKVCTTCQGHGRVRVQQGFFAVERPCGTCKGTGHIIEKPCKKCHGEGLINQEKTLNVTIPAGVEEGTRIRLSGEGEPSSHKGAPAGDLYIFISVKDHSLFMRENANLFCRATISMAKAALGTSIEVPSIDGTPLKLDIPAGTQSGKQMRLKGKGMKGLQSHGRGDLYVEVRVETPQKLSTKQKELLKEFDGIDSEKTHPESTSFMKKIKDFLGNFCI